MANTINWGEIYCYTEFGLEDFTVAESIPDFSAPECFLDSITGGQTETLALTIDDTLLYSVDRTDITADLTLITLFN
jgi:hypothetical protein